MIARSGAREIAWTDSTSRRLCPHGVFFLCMSIWLVTHTRRLPRPDVEKAVAVHREEPSSPGKWQGTCCSICSRDWYVDSEYACELKCGHWLCLECVTEIVDEAGRGNLMDGETDPGQKYWRCSECRDINPVLKDRADIIQPDELQYWRYKIANHRLIHEITDWLWRMEQAELDGWCPALPPHLSDERANPADIKEVRKVHVHMPDAVQVMEAVPIYVASLLNWGYSLDNPTNTKEADVLKACLVAELQRLASSKRKFNSTELVEHMKTVGERAFVPHVVSASDQRLGNPILPPGYVAYREFLCKWTALGCFLSPSGRTEVVGFMREMEKNKSHVWWKDVREVFFNRGAPVQ
ncbi:hypothetical protein P153DRAFT_312662 [Dothidotthia symphoricarpi CBS 119687]|uniref:RING-type domain-containing protein n=1 Tax=Dothidotthia symphoricarpi CBS 119687 TaxID=1392245 RepID=A0A6A6AHL4_9PLEO|nr:uncharacterized protein P153DRAFT_312662 [Dothidotthia symphoricarpi CBS 119687]KAF2130743.1 hypothetical protein P153DRAFT_312662 [Dothidotthia symphoricarpi CBS 119687]